MAATALGTSVVSCYHSGVPLSSCPAVDLSQSAAANQTVKSKEASDWLKAPMGKSILVQYFSQPLGCPDSHVLT